MALLDYDKAKVPLEHIIESTGGGGAASIAVLATLLIATSTLIYFLYRSLIYDRYVMDWLDTYCRGKERQTYRTWVIDTLKDKKKVTTLQAQNLAILLDKEKLGDKHYTGSLRRAYAGTHSLYLAGILGFLTYLSSFLWLDLSQPYILLRLLLLILFAGICLVAGFLLDASQSEQGALALRAKTNDVEILDAARKIGLIT